MEEMCGSIQFDFDAENHTLHTFLVKDIFDTGGNRLRWLFVRRSQTVLP